MGFVDIVLTVAIIAGAVYLLYRSVWKKRGHCPGCDGRTCDKPDRTAKIAFLESKRSRRA